jgi:hypothetical protein
MVLQAGNEVPLTARDLRWVSAPLVAATVSDPKWPMLEELQAEKRKSGASIVLHYQAPSDIHRFRRFRRFKKERKQEQQELLTKPQCSRLQPIVSRFEFRVSSWGFTIIRRCCWSFRPLPLRTRNLKLGTRNPLKSADGRVAFTQLPV